MPLQLAGRDTLLGIAHQRNGRKPLAQRQVGIVKQGPGQRAELELAGGTLKQVTRPASLVLRLDRPALAVIAGQAVNPIRPTGSDQMVKSMLLGRKLPRQGIQIDR
jgi:hypothetical protein